jgi:hypothetical protein
MGIRTAAAGPSICTGPAAHQALAARLSRDITKALAGRRGTHAVTVYDRVTGLACRLNEGHRFDCASVVKATILAANPGPGPSPDVAGPGPAGPR